MSTDWSATSQTKKGLVIINTGPGKGKTTAALGTLMRAWGHGMRPCVVQFIKQASTRRGAAQAEKKLDIEWHEVGDGFTWLSDDLEVAANRARHAWEITKEIISSERYDLVILDEFTYPLAYEWLDTGEVISWLRENKPPMLHLIITGRSAPRPLKAFADLVTDMRDVKHPFRQGIKAQPGIDF